MNIENQKVEQQAYISNQGIMHNPNTSAPLTPKNTYAIIVGISNYPGSDNDLTYCDDDAEAVYSMLIDDYNFKQENIIYLKDYEATKEKISSAFDQIAGKIKSDDIFFFYYSGHGGADTENSGIHFYSINSPHPYSNNWDTIWSIYHEDAAYIRVHFVNIALETGYDYLYLGDTDLYNDWYYQSFTGYSSDIWSDWIPLLSDNKIYIRMITDYSNTDWGFQIDKYEVEIYNGIHYLCPYDSVPSSPDNYYIDTLLNSKLDALNCAEKYVVCDSCNSGGLIPEIQGLGNYIMMSCAEEEISLEDPERQNGCFTYYFLRSMEYATDLNGNGVISMEECYNYTYYNTISRSTSLGIVHHPQEYDGISDEAILSTTFGSVSLVPTGNSLAYSFNLYGTGSIEELDIIVYNISQNLNYKIMDLTLSPSSNTGFGSYSGTIQLEEVSGITGYGIFAKIQGDRLIYIHESISDDLDNDFLEDAIEILNGLNPLMVDTDLDGLDDYTEFYGQTDPLDYDTDDDGLNDGSEVTKYKTNPTNPDTDGDGFLDGLEVEWGTDPLDPRSSLITIFLNISGIVILSCLIFFVVYKQVIKKNHNKNEKPIKGKFIISKDHEGYNILKIEKKYKIRVPSYGYRPSYTPYSRSMFTGQLDAKKLKDLLLYGTPPPKSRYSTDGQKALIIAKMAFESINRGNIIKTYDLMVSALMLGVPEPINSQIKKILLDSVKNTQDYSNSGVQNNLTPHKKCSGCGKINENKYKYCTECGRLL